METALTTLNEKVENLEEKLEHINFVLSEQVSDALNRLHRVEDDVNELQNRIDDLGRTVIQMGGIH